MAKLTKKQQGELTEKLTGIIRETNALQLRLSADKSVNEMNINQISGALNRMHGQAIGKELPTVINIQVKQLGSGDPSPDNIRPIVVYNIDGIGEICEGVINMDSFSIYQTYDVVNLETLRFTYNTTYNTYFTADLIDVMYYASIQGLNTDYKSEYYKVYTGSVSAFPEYTFEVGTSGNLWVRTVTGIPLGRFVYPLREPRTITLTPEQMIQLLDQL